MIPMECVVAITTTNSAEITSNKLRMPFALKKYECLFFMPFYITIPYNLLKYFVLNIFTLYQQHLLTSTSFVFALNKGSVNFPQESLNGTAT